MKKNKCINCAAFDKFVLILVYVSLAYNKKLKEKDERIQYLESEIENLTSKYP